MAVVHINSDQAFYEIAKKHGGDNTLIVVDYFATWCGPCKVIAPEFESLSKQYSEAVFLKVDVDKCPGVSAEASVRAMPTFHLYRASQKVGEVVGADIESLKNHIAKEYGSAPAGESKAAPPPDAAVPTLTESSRVSDFKTAFKCKGIDWSGCIEKEDMVRLARKNGLL
mmetsp:Transcript_35333/g.99601  ORF Transcript_35333/g.99601 Transcript_35333/m.99601 type:complete len:169 (-) Transcript_35333:288-794(-)